MFCMLKSPPWVIMWWLSLQQLLVRGLLAVSASIPNALQCVLHLQTSIHTQSCNIKLKNTDPAVDHASKPVNRWCLITCTFCCCREGRSHSPQQVHLRQGFCRSRRGLRGGGAYPQERARPANPLQRRPQATSPAGPCLGAGAGHPEHP